MFVTRVDVYLVFEEKTSDSPNARLSFQICFNHVNS